MYYYCKYSVALPRGALKYSAVYDCAIFWSNSLTYPYIYKSVGFNSLILFHFSKYPMKIETKLFHFHSIFKIVDREGGSSEHPEPTLDPAM